jgi:hypothetical protein
MVSEAGIENALHPRMFDKEFGQCAGVGAVSLHADLKGAQAAKGQEGVEG